LRPSQCFIAGNLKLGNEPTSDHGDFDSSIQGLWVLKEFALKISEEAEPWEISKLQTPDPEWKTEKTNLLTFPFRMCSLQSFSDVSQKSIDWCQGHPEKDFETFIKSEYTC
jgi:hypothetical protein